MINTKEYDHTLSSLLEEGKVDGWSIIKNIARPGEEAICWFEGEGTYRDKYADPYPRVVLASEDTIWMMDTPFEQQTAAPAVRGAKGKCLVVGLGIGMVPVFFARKPNVEKVRVLELSPEVIRLVGAQLLSPRNILANPWLGKIEISRGDFWEYSASARDRFDTVQVDIWPTALTAITNCNKAIDVAKRLLSRDGRVYCWMAEHRQLIKEAPPQPRVPREKIVEEEVE